LRERVERLRSVIERMGWVRFKRCLSDPKCLERVRGEVNG